MEKQSFLRRLTGSGKGVPQKSHAAVKNSPSPDHTTTKKMGTDMEQCVLDVYQTKNDLVIRAFIAGVRPEDLDISIINSTLTIRGMRTEGDLVTPQDYYYQECYFGPFSRSVILPEGSHGDIVKATLKDGILTIRLPKGEKKSIAINAD